MPFCIVKRGDAQFDTLVAQEFPSLITSEVGAFATGQTPEGREEMGSGGTAGQVVYLLPVLQPFDINYVRVFLQVEQIRGNLLEREQRQRHGQNCRPWLGGVLHLAHRVLYFCSTFVSMQRQFTDCLVLGSTKSQPWCRA